MSECDPADRHWRVVLSFTGSSWQVCGDLIEGGSERGVYADCTTREAAEAALRLLSGKAVMCGG